MKNDFQVNHSGNQSVENNLPKGEEEELPAVIRKLASWFMPKRKKDEGDVSAWMDGGICFCGEIMDGGVSITGGGISGGCANVVAS